MAHQQDELNFDATIARMERRLEAAKTMRSILVDFPELRLEFMHSNVNSELDSPLNLRAPIRAKLANFARIRRFFKRHGNQWFQSSQIAHEVGLSRGTVATVLWTTHSTKFEQKPVPGAVKKKLWRMRPEFLEPNGKESE